MSDSSDRLQCSHGGGDLIDQLKVTNQLNRKHSFRFYLQIFFDLMEISVVKAFIIFQKLKNETQLTLSDFKYNDVLDPFFCTCTVHRQSRAYRWI